MNFYFLRLLASFVFSISLLLSTAQTYTYNNKNPEGLKLVSSSQKLMKFTYTVNSFNLSPIQVEGKTMKHVNYGLSLVPGKEGSPELPFIGKTILIPDGSSISVKIISSEEEIYNDIDISPAAKIPFDTQAEIPPIKGSEYSRNELFPSEIVAIETTEIRGMQMANIGISPFQYNPISKQLIVHKNIEFQIQINHSKGTYGENRFRSPFWDQILMDLVYNSGDIPEIDYNKRNTTTKELGCEYLIVVPNHEEFIAWADTIKKFRNEQGIETKVITIDEVGGNDVETINNFFDDVYANWNPVPSAVLLMADYGTDDMGITSKSWPHPYEGTYVSDNYYADVTGNNLPDFVFARLTARHAEDLEVMVNKFIHYESNPPTDASFYNHPITALGWQTERWFQICTETIGGYMTNNLGKEPSRINAIYDGNPNTDPWSTASNTYAVTNYFGPNGLNYIPSSPSDLGGWTGGSPSDIIQAINAGAFILQHRDHGYYGGWGEPAFNSSHINQLNNIDKPCHIFSINCLTGQFDEGSGSFGEKFHRYANGGALSLTAPSQVSYSFVNDAFVWGMYDNMWPDFMPDYGSNQIPERDFRPAFGAASGKYFLQSTSWASSSIKTITYRLFHHHGDAFNVVYTEVPQDNEVAFELGITSDVTTLNIQAIPHSLVGLSVNENYLANGITDANGNVDISFDQQDPGTIIKVVVTKQNYFRYEGETVVIPAEGSYIVKTGYTIHDENANGVLEYNEEVSLDFSVKNVGVEQADNVIVTITTDDEYIQMIDDSEDYGNISSGQEINIDNAFKFSIPVDVPDDHIITFYYSATDGNEIWESDFKLTAYAPHLEYTFLSFEEIEGNGNGFLDPGETVMASFEVKNTGHLEFPAGSSTLTENSSYVTINADIQNFEAIGIDETLTTQFEMTTSTSTPPTSTASILNQIQAEPFNFEREMYFSIGIIVEDWESEGFTEFNWSFEGDSEWEIATDYVSEGNYSAKINNLNDNESAALILEYNVLAENKISFNLQVSSQENKDFLNFYIDDVAIATWSGLVLFEQASFIAPAGIHSFKWEYIKDEAEHSGLDAAWIDFIILPPGDRFTSTDESLSQHYNSKIQINPNPASDYVLIRNTSESSIKQIKLLTIFGSTLINDPNPIPVNASKTIHIEKLQNGIYFLQIIFNDGKVETKKLIVK